jgi:hypothetical protein
MLLELDLWIGFVEILLVLSAIDIIVLNVDLMGKISLILFNVEDVPKHGTSLVYLTILTSQFLIGVTHGSMGIVPLILS